MFMLRKLLVWSLPLALAIATTFAQTTDQSKNLKEMQKQATRLDKSSNQGQEAVFNSLSQQLNVPVDTLKAQQTNTKFSPGQLFIANSLAASSGKTFDQLAQEFKSGKGWGEIAKEDNLNLGKVVSDLKRANKKVEEARAEQAQANGHGPNAGNSSESAGSSSHGAANASQQGHSEGAGSSSPGAANASQQGNSMGHGGGQAAPRGKR
jgi:hypothetical protein